MKALTALSKFTRCYDRWQNIISRYNLKWSSGDSLQIFHDIVNEKTSFSGMMEWVRDAISKLPEPYYNVLIYNTLTGLCPTEACVSLSLIQQETLGNYFNREKSLLEHFRYPEFFIRRTKKEYITIASDLVIEIAKKSYQKPSYNALKLVLSRRKLKVNMYYCRKIFATI